MIQLHAHARTHACMHARTHTHRDTHTHIHNRFTALLDFVWDYPGEMDLLEQEIISGSGIIWAICKSTPWPRQISMPASHHSVFYRPDALPATQPTLSKDWRHWWFNCS